MAELLLPFEDYHYGGFDLVRAVKFDTKILNICAKFHKNLTFTFQEITASVTNKRTNQPTNSRDHKTSWRRH